MSNIPKARTWLVNYWENGKVFHSIEVDAPTKFLAKLNLCFGREPWPLTYDKRTISPLRSTHGAGRIVP
jgi:hypothetical protein